MTTRVALAAALMLANGRFLAAQNVQTDPLRCWWRTSAGAVRVGEPFSVVLTCAVLESDTTKVIVDRSKLDPGAIQLAPFEVVGGAHAADLVSGERRFFQYEYRVRLIADNVFGKDVPLPQTKLSYHVQSAVSQGAAIQGREQTYVLPQQSVRVLSLVPSDASDIRDATGETFTDIDERSFRASLLVVTGGVLLALAALMGLLALVRLVGRYRTPTAATGRLTSDAAILRAVGGELRAVQRAREADGWTPELAARALAALRVAAAYALGRRVAQSFAGDGRSQATGARPSGDGRQPSADGLLTVRIGWPRGKRIAVSGSVTPQAIGQEIARSNGLVSARRTHMLEALEQALARFTTAQYGREAAFDAAALDESLADSAGAVRRLMFEQISPLRRLARRRVRTAG